MASIWVRMKASIQESLQFLDGPKTENNMNKCIIPSELFLIFFFKFFT